MIFPSPFPHCKSDDVQQAVQQAVPYFMQKMLDQVWRSLQPNTNHNIVGLKAISELASYRK
jgi:hypothetical protein